jgi:3-dehydrosphinganine reductase
VKLAIPLLKNRLGGVAYNTCTDISIIFGAQTMAFCFSSCFVFSSLVFSSCDQPRLSSSNCNVSLTGKELLEHIVITGGSSGIGFSFAKECLRNPKLVPHIRHLTIIARTKKQLASCKEELESIVDEAQGRLKVTIHTLAVDITDYHTLCKTVGCYMADTGSPPTMLCNVAGASSAGYMIDTPATQYDWLMRVNYLGSVHITKVFLPHMLRGGRSAAILFTSSAAGQLGLVGYSAYSPSKFALRGLAEALSMELSSNKKMSVTVCYPPDTSTPGYGREMSAGDKPKELELISQGGGLFSSEVVAKTTLQATLRGDHAVYFGLEGWMLSSLTAGMTPVTNLLDAICQISLMGVFRFVSLFYLLDFRRTVAKCQKQSHEKSPTSLCTEARVSLERDNEKEKVK